MFSNKSLEERKHESIRIKGKYPNRIPIIVKKDKNCTLEDIDKEKYLVPKDMSLSQFMFVIRKRIHLEPATALFILINGNLINGTKIMDNIFNEHKQEDGFLYVTYTSENTFG